MCRMKRLIWILTLLFVFVAENIVCAEGLVKDKNILKFIAPNGQEIILYSYGPFEKFKQEILVEDVNHDGQKDYIVRFSIQSSYPNPTAPGGKIYFWEGPTLVIVDGKSSHLLFHSNYAWGDKGNISTSYPELDACYEVKVDYSYDRSVNTIIRIQRPGGGKTKSAKYCFRVEDIFIWNAERQKFVLNSSRKISER